MTLSDAFCTLRHDVWDVIHRLTKFCPIPRWLSCLSQWHTDSPPSQHWGISENVLWSLNRPLSQLVHSLRPLWLCSDTLSVHWLWYDGRSSRSVVVTDCPLGIRVSVELCPQSFVIIWCLSTCSTYWERLVMIDNGLDVADWVTHCVFRRNRVSERK